MEINLMIEGQEDVSWDDWTAIARTCEEVGLGGLFRSDHYASVKTERPRGSLDAWTTLAGLAAVTSRLRLGTLVSPVTFRHPSLLAKAVATVDQISNGRAELGLGAGWHDYEHDSYGFPFPNDRVRMEMLEEQLEIVTRQWTEESFSFKGRHYELNECRALPKPHQSPRPPILVGGAGGRRSARLAARWGDEYNTTAVTLEECRARRSTIAREWEREGRDPGTLRFSMMARVIVGATEDEVVARARRLMNGSGESGDPRAWLREHSDRWVVGTPQQALDRLGELSEAGVDRVMLQNLLHGDLDAVAVLGNEVAPHLG
jgi:F420-dependent oxidoreductase-like protein